MSVLAEAKRHLAAGRAVVPLYPQSKKPIGNNWQTAWQDGNTVLAHLEQSPDCNLGLAMGQVIDIEADDEQQEVTYQELFAGVDEPRTPSFTSSRGRHRFFKAHPRLSTLGKAVVSVDKLGIRIGGKAAQTCIPPSVNADGSVRAWEVSFDECQAAELPELVVDRILAALEAKPVDAAPALAVSGDVQRTVAGMLRMDMQDGNDGSKRLFAYACRAVEHNLNDSDAIAAIRQTEVVKPFPQSWSDADILTRMRDAEKETTRGCAVVDLRIAEGRTDASNAKRFADAFRDSVRYCEPWNKWLVWDGRRWAQDDTCQVEALSKQTANALWGEISLLATGPNRPDETTIKNMTGWASKSSSSAGLANMLRVARSEPGIPILPAALDADPFLLNVANGTLDLKTGALRDPQRADLISKLAPVEYRADAACPTWLAFLNRILPDRELVNFVQRFGGYCLTGDVREQALVIFHGDGANGKSTLLNVLLDVLGEYAVKTNEGLLKEKHGDSHPTEVASLAGRRLAVASETSQQMRLAESRVKELTGGEKITARRMREDFWTFDPTFKIIVATNHRPEIKGIDTAIWRRIRLAPFGVSIPPAEQDRTLADKLKAEYPGILRWLVDGCLEWQRSGLGAPKAIEQATASYREAEDILAEFLGRCCQVKAGAVVGSTRLLDDYKRFSGDRDMKPRSFTTLMKARGFVAGQFSSGPERGLSCWNGLEINCQA